MKKDLTKTLSQPNNCLVWLQRYNKAALLTCIFFATFQPLQAQFRTGQRFAAGIIAGFTASQIDGDVSAGYHKVGLQGGLSVMTKLKEKQAFSIEMLFTQRGARNQPTYPPVYSTTLNYVEIPIQWHYFDWEIAGVGKQPNWYRAQLNAGITYARLINATDKFEDGFGISSAIPDLNKNSICGALGASLYFNRHVGLTFRYHRAFHFLYRPGPGKTYANNLYEHFIAVQLNYRI